MSKESWRALRTPTLDRRVVLFELAYFLLETTFLVCLALAAEVKLLTGLDDPFLAAALATGLVTFLADGFYKN